MSSNSWAFTARFPLKHESSEIHAGKHDRTDIFALNTANFSNLAFVNTMTRYLVWTHRVSDVSDCMALIVTIDDQTFHRRHIYWASRFKTFFSEIWYLLLQDSASRRFQHLVDLTFQ